MKTKVLKASEKQYNKLNGYRNRYSILNFSTDINGNKILGIGILKDKNFIEIREELKKLEVIDLEPINFDNPIT